MGDRLDGTVALVTGASSGIGAATVRALVAEGARVAAVARRQERLDELATELNDGSRRVLPLEADITEQAQAIAAVERTVREFGRLDTVINNAGVMLLGPITDAPTDEWDRMIAINLRGLMYVTHAALPHLAKAAQDAPRRVADVVNVSSVAGRVAREGSGVYNATKWGVGAFTESLRQEVTRSYVRVSVIEPGAVATELASHMRPEVRERSQARFADVVRLEADDIADAIVYIVTRQRDVAVNEMLVRPTTQSG